SMRVRLERIIGPLGNDADTVTRRTEKRASRQGSRLEDLRSWVVDDDPEPATPVLERRRNVEARLGELAKSVGELLPKPETLAVEVEDRSEIRVHVDRDEVVVQRRAAGQLHGVQRFRP